MLNLKVTQERLYEVIDMPDFFNLSGVTIIRAYEYLLEFVVDDAGEYVGKERAAEMMKEAHVKRAELGEYWRDFMSKVNEAFVPKVNGATSEEQS